MFTVIQALEDDGHKVVPLTLKLDQNRDSKYDHYFMKSPFGSQVAKLGESKLGFFQKIKLAAQAVYYPEAKRAVSRIIEQEDIDVVYLLNICNYISPSVINGAKDKGVRVVMRLSDFNFICASYQYLRNGKICMDCKKNFLNAIRYNCSNGSPGQTLARTVAITLHKYSGIYQKVDAFVCPSNIVRNELVDFGLPENRVHFVPSFVNVDHSRSSFCDDGYVLYFGRLDREKGVDILLEAWRLLGANAPPLRIIGSGKEAENLRCLVVELGLANVSFEPFLEREELMARLSVCTFVVIPSVWHENSPMTVFESMAMGKVIIASQMSGLQDQVQDGQTGILVPAGDPQALAKAVENLINDPERLNTMGKAARFRSDQYFSQDVHMRKLLSLFRG